MADGTRALNRSGIAQPLARVAGSTDWRAALGDVPVEAWMSSLALAQVVTPEILEVAALRRVAFLDVGADALQWGLVRDGVAIGQVCGVRQGHAGGGGGG